MNRTFFIWIGVFIATFGIIGFLIYQGQKAAAPKYYAQASVIASDDWVKIAPNQKIVLVEYGDFQCPACAVWEPIIQKIAKDYQDKVTFVFRHFPLPQHGNAIPSSLAAEAAGRQGKFWEMHDLLYAKQQEWSEKDFAPLAKQYATDLKLDVAKFEADMKDQALRDRIQRDINDGNGFDVNATPAFFINGTQYQAKSEQDFRSKLDAQLAK